ncbi:MULTISPECIES: DUF2163 domain-containing protein [Brucella]|uniref:DUF2163 domain-containing protein n=1 Tax=Brucella TaxID=234 RepID=UPI0008775B5D|nr:MULTISPECIES: DUF2163 domain-containing protein [Brucella]ARZ03399.1 hypothetical protein BK152_03225 [Brucella melitensis]
MIPVPPALESHLQGEVTTHCFAWLIRRLDGAVLGFTDHDAPLTVDQVICDPLTGLNSSEASTALGLGIAGGEVEGVLSSTQISDEDIEQGRYDGATIEAFLVNWDEPDQHMLLRRWAAGKISRSGSRFVMELKGVAAAFDAVRGRRILRHCDAMLGDKRCGIDTGDPRFFAQGTVLVAEGTRLDVAGVDGFAAGWFSEGRLAWTSGANRGRAVRVVGHAGASLQLGEPMILPVAAGDAFWLVCGCDKSFATCKAKFANGVNFRGFPHLPGNDAAYAYVNSTNDYDGGVLVP